MYFNSPTLLKAGFSLPPEGAFLDFFLDEARSRSFVIDLNLEGIAHIVDAHKPFSPNIKPNELTPAAIGDLILEIKTLADQYGITIRISEEAFGEEYISVAESTTNNLNIPYFRYFWDPSGRADIWGSEDYATYPRDPRGKSADAIYMMDLINFGTLGNRLGLLELTFAGSRGFGHRKCCRHQWRMGIDRRSRSWRQFVSCCSVCPHQLFFRTCEL